MCYRSPFIPLCFALLSSALCLHAGTQRPADGVPAEFPHTVVKDSSAFTAIAKLRIGRMKERSPVAVLRQTTAKTGWVLGLVGHGARGVIVEICCNGAYLTAGWIHPKREGEEHTLTLTARKGLVVVYLDGEVLRRFHALITPNLEPVKVFHGEGVDVLSVEFLGPEREYYAPGEPRGPAEGFCGGVGWLVSCPPELQTPNPQPSPQNSKLQTPPSPLPRILCYGDSVLSGYGKRLRKLLEGGAYVFTWGGFVTEPAGEKLDRRRFLEAAAIKPFDYIVFNNGLHSLHWTPDKVSDAQVKETQRSICRAFKAAAPQAKVFWLATTPHTSRKRNAAGKVDALGELDGMVQRINRLSAEAMREENVPVIDAYSLLASRLDLAAGDAYHWTAEGYDRLSELIANSLGLMEK